MEERPAQLGERPLLLGRKPRPRGGVRRPAGERGDPIAPGDLELREALRRAVDLRDALARSGTDGTTRAVFLVAVLIHLTELLGYDTAPLIEDL